MDKLVQYSFEKPPQKSLQKALVENILKPSDNVYLLNVIRHYWLDEQQHITKPLGLLGKTLEADYHIIHGAKLRIQNSLKCVREIPLDVDAVVFAPIASAQIALNRERKDEGALVIDIGGGTTDIAIWKDGSLVHSQIVPVGGNHFTNDLAVALKIPHTEAERIKINHGCVLAEQLNQSAHITAQGLSGTKPREVQLSLIADVLGARAEELFQIIKHILADKNIGNEITGDIVLSGGGALIKGVAAITSPTETACIHKGCSTA